MEVFHDLDYEGKDGAQIRLHHKNQREILHNILRDRIFTACSGIVMGFRSEIPGFVWGSRQDLENFGTPTHSESLGESAN